MSLRSKTNELDMELARVAKRVRQWREEAGLTLQELGNQSGVSTRTIQKVESLQMIPSVAVLLKISRGLRRSASELVSEAPARASVIHLAQDDRHPVGRRRRMVVERLSGNLVDAEVEMWRVTLQPGLGSGQGTLAYDGEDDYLLRPGDVLHFKASAPHSWHNTSDSVARFSILGTVSPALREALHRRLSEPGRRRASAK
jgi:transcriptional regulator with XRE-family HTH domain